MSTRRQLETFSAAEMLLFLIMIEQPGPIDQDELADLFLQALDEYGTPDAAVEARRSHIVAGAIQ